MPRLRFSSKALGLCLLYLVGLPAASALALETPHYRVQITPQCEEGEISCERVEYLGRHKDSGRSLKLLGRTHHTLCADGVTPCRFLGYLFRNGRTTYWVGEDGTLRVTVGKRLLLEESGQWRDE
jgi:hypothetical protein